METAKLFLSGQNQAVRLPKEYRFNGDEVYIKKVGNTVFLYPKDQAWETFLAGVDGFTDDFMPDGRMPQLPLLAKRWKQASE
jgi:antitoxin VapB